MEHLLKDQHPTDHDIQLRALAVTPAAAIASPRMLNSRMLTRAITQTFTFKATSITPSAKITRTKQRAT